MEPTLLSQIQYNAEAAVRHMKVVIALSNGGPVKPLAKRDVAPRKVYYDDESPEE